MSAATTLPAELVEAYRRTEYHVDWPDGSDAPLKIGQRCDKLARGQGQGWAFIAACNPFARACTDDENFALHFQLQRLTEARGLQSLSGRGQGTDNDWPTEESLLIFDLGRSEAEELGRQFHQNAIVWIGPDHIARLVLPV